MKTVGKEIHVKKLSLAKKIIYGSGDFAQNLGSNALIAAFFMMYCTNVVGIGAGVVGTLLLLGRIWDMINDTWVGAWSDKTNTRFGHYRPWMLIGNIPLFAITILLFWAHPEWGTTQKIIYVYVLYFAWAFAYTCVGIPYTAMTAVMSQDAGDRGALGAFRMAGCQLAQVAVGAVFLSAVARFGGGNDARGYLMATIMVAIPSIIILFICTAVSKEVVPQPKDQESIPIFKGIKLAFQNKQYICVLIGMFLGGFVTLGRMSIQSYYFLVVQKNVGALSVYLIVTGLTAVAGSVLSPYVTNLLKSKPLTIRIFALGAAVVTLIQFFGRFDGGALFWFGGSAYNFCYFMLLSQIFGATPDCAELGFLKSGSRLDGFYGAFASFWHKAGIALGSALAGWVLAWTHYDAGAAVQPHSVILGLNFMMFIFPIITSLFMAFVFLFYKIDYKRSEEILIEIRDKYGESVIAD
ncbi:MAG TPA: glycoside-pentoside-hexuronide (GPH):cation symporter [Candidatus Eubacterium avistercoris]|uniref:Glycoside-pentoside-hexuronide (GPH):cation symporter n=1 Tax=Candidatus Eubacterium avistercoris TaxID=2838567 RepID=A0A9D2IFZ0_9FIRM|nr:glycoside-pentoside-hexuronide (GPH):cation symporter [Candidatus Eubacterium avistercoris]